MTEEFEIDDDLHPIDGVPEGCYCGHGAYHHEGGGWPVTPINGRCRERGCDCSEFQRRLPESGSTGDPS